MGRAGGSYEADKDGKNKKLVQQTKPPKAVDTSKTKLEAHSESQATQLAAAGAKDQTKPAKSSGKGKEV